MTRLNFRTRRFARVALVGAPLLALLLTLLLVGQFAHAEPPTKILFIGKEPDHPYGSHMSMHVGRVLAQCAERAPGVAGIGPRRSAS